MHVIAPHKGMKKQKEEFVIDGLFYHFFRPLPSDLLAAIDNKLFRGKLVTYKENRNKVEAFIHNISPDIVILVGTENPYYSCTVLGIEDIPIYILCQNVYNNPENRCACDAMTYHKRATVEKNLLMKSNYFGVYSEKHRALLRANGYSGYIFCFQWPNGEPFVAEPVDNKQYDFINFANSMSSNKGYHDCINALARVKDKYPNVQLALVDNGPGSVKNELIEIIGKNGLEGNVTFIPFFEKKTDLLQFLKCVRFAVLPCKVDHISGTMLQSMEQGLPIVVYKTTGTPLLNADKQCVLIADMNDVNGLADNMLKLMEDEALGRMLSTNAMTYMSEYRKNNEGRMEQLIVEFRAIIDHFNTGRAIPEELLYD